MTLVNLLPFIVRALSHFDSHLPLCSLIVTDTWSCAVREISHISFASTTTDLPSSLVSEMKLMF